MMAKKSLYEELTSIAFDDETEKTAEEMEQEVGDQFESLDIEELKKIAAELDNAISDKTAGDGEQEDTGDDDGSGTPTEEKPAENKKEEKPAEKKKEEKPAEKKKEEAEGSEEGKAAADKDVESEDKEAEVEQGKEAEESEEESFNVTATELTKFAYEVVEQKLSALGFGLEDYVRSYIDDPEVAASIAENAQKLAYLSDGDSVIKIADEIIGTVFEKVAAEAGE